jgi:hypothetical protein
VRAEQRFSRSGTDLRTVLDADATLRAEAP